MRSRPLSLRRPRDWGNIITFIGRLKPGVTLAQARQEAAGVAPSMCWNNRRPQICGSYKDPVADAVERLCKRTIAARRWLCCGAR